MKFTKLKKFLLLIASINLINIPTNAIVSLKNSKNMNNYFYNENNYSRKNKRNFSILKKSFITTTRNKNNYFNSNKNNFTKLNRSLNYPNKRKKYENIHYNKNNLIENDVNFNFINLNNNNWIVALSMTPEFILDELKCNELDLSYLEVEIVDPLNNIFDFDLRNLKFDLNEDLIFIVKSSNDVSCEFDENFELINNKIYKVRFYNSRNLLGEFKIKAKSFI